MFRKDERRSVARMATPTPQELVDQAVDLMNKCTRGEIDKETCKTKVGELIDQFPGGPQGGGLDG